MEREHVVSMSITNNGECICNPEILLGTKYGLWDFENEVAPRGTLLDLNAAWELFLSRKGLTDLSFREKYHNQHEVIDGVVYEDGDTTYTLIDDQGNPTNATFTIKANKGPVEHIEWQDGNLILYYTKTRPATEDDITSGVPLHYVKDNDGNIVIDQETGKPLIYDYVKIPVIEIFDNDETHKLFPWFADDQHTVRLRQNLDVDDQEHLGDFAVTSNSEVFVAKERFESNQGNTLVSLQSIYDQLKQDLGIELTYTNVPEIVDSEGSSIHQRASGSNLDSVLNTEDKTSIVDAINEVSQNNYDVIALISGEQRTTPIDNIKTYLDFNDYIQSHLYSFVRDEQGNVDGDIRNILWALNNLQHFDLGDFQEQINQGIFTQQQTHTITQALNNIFAEAEANKERIGFANGQWIQLNTDLDSRNNLTDAINNNVLHIQKLAEAIPLTQVNSEGHIGYYNNDTLNTITKNRVPNPSKLRTTIVEDINELQNQIGNLSSTASGVSTPVELTTDDKSTLVQAINEVDLHADNNYKAIGGRYALNSEGEKDGYIINLNTTAKDTIVDAINELDQRIGDLSGLDVDDKEDLVEAINEIVAEQPYVYEDISNPESGVVLKNGNNHAGERSLVNGKNNTGGKNSLINGTGNTTSTNYTTILGKDNTVLSGTTEGTQNVVFGESNTVQGQSNLVNGKNNYINGSYNTVSQFATKTNPIKQNVQGIRNVVLGYDNQVNGTDIINIGNSNYNTNIRSEECISIGKNNQVSDGSITLGSNNNTRVNSVIVGNNNIAPDYKGNNYIFGKDQSIQSGNNNIVIGLDEKSYQTLNNAVVINGINIPHDNSTHIGKDIYIQTHDTESKLQELAFVNLNDWCKDNNASSLNSDKFLSTEHVANALRVYLTKNYTDNALLRFTMLDNNQNGYIIVQGNSARVYLNGTWYYTNNINNGWSRQDGVYLKVITQNVVNQQGATVTKHYLAFMDQLSTTPIVDTVGAQRSSDYDNVNPENFGTIDLTKAYGAVDFDDINAALNLNNRFNNKVDKYAQIITNYVDDQRVTTPISQNFIDPTNQANSANITLDLKESFGFDREKYQLISEKGQANGYVPLNGNQKIDQRYLPSYVDDVIDVWAEYVIDSVTGAPSDIRLYEIIDDTSTGQHVARKGVEIVTGETGKIYIEAQPSERPQSLQFRWTGTQWIPVGYSNLVIGTVTGTAFDGGRGYAVERGLEDHLNSGTTAFMEIPGAISVGTKLTDRQAILVNEAINTTYAEGDNITGQDALAYNNTLTGEPISVIYKPNPHNVRSEQISVTVNDPNDSRNINIEDPFNLTYSVKSAIQELFNRINAEEDKSGIMSNIIGTPEEIQALDDLDNVEGNDSPTIIGTLLNTKEDLESFTALNNTQIATSVTNNFKFYGEN